jgi:tetratricopeptide (TPR) repeat protein
MADHNQMDKEKVARCLILQYLQACSVEDVDHSDEFEVAIDCLKSIWSIDDPTMQIPGIHSIVDLVPNPKYNTELAMQLKADGNTALKDGRFDEAIKKYTEAIEVDPTQSTFYCNRAAVYSKINQHEKAIEDGEKAIQLDPNYANAYSRLGYAYYQIGKMDEARKAYKRGIRACPDHQGLKDNLASLGPDQSAAPPRGPAAAGPGMDLNALFGKFVNNPDMLRVIQERMEKPEFQALLQDPEFARKFEEVSTNPLALTGLLSHPKFGEVANLLLGGSG